MTNICLTSCKKKYLLDLKKPNVLCILSDKYDKNQANNLFHYTLDQTYKIDFGKGHHG